MKKAIIDQLFLGFLLLMGMVTFVATVNDETSTRNYIYDLKALSKSSAEAMARYYENNIDMCTAQTITTNILNQQKLGLDSLNDGLVSYRWWDSDSDGEPDQVTATIAQHPHDSFWYRFFDKDDFTVGPFSWTEPVNTPKNVTITYGGEDAGYTNMVGLYELDSNNCVSNPRIILANSDDNSMIGQLLNNGNAITSPPTYIFLMSNGYNTFANGSDRPTESDIVTMNHCFSDVTDNTSNPDVTINGVTKHSANVYFEQNELNGDEYHHIQIIPANVWVTYNHFVNGTGTYNGQGTKTYDQFIAECNIVNYDNDDYNNIPSTDYEEGENDCIYDRNNEYHYAMEDLNGGGDEDFNDIFLNTTRVVIPNQLNTYTVQNDGSINLTCSGNSAPSLSIQCPSPIDENTSTIISYTASDSDGNISTTFASALNGTVVNNNDGTVTYTPDPDFFGIDTLSISVQDNEGASDTQTCTITVNEVNSPPTISGTPMTSIEAGNNYIFIPLANDVDGDTLSFSISNRPSWATFSSTTGQLSGVPSNSDVNTYSNILISVSDGTDTVSLPLFNITVTENTTNNPPSCGTIPTQNAVETEIFNTLNLDTYCTDSDSGDDVSYTLSASSLGGYTETTDGLVVINPIPNGSASYSPVTVTVTATDGKDSITTSFILNITEKTAPSFLHTFTNNDEGWTEYDSGWIEDSGEGKLEIQPDNTTEEHGSEFTFDFGSSFANKDVNISFDVNFVGGWESSGGSQDDFIVYINDVEKERDNYGDGTDNYISSSYSLTGITNGTGKVKIRLAIEVSYTAETAYIDNVSVELD